MPKKRATAQISKLGSYLKKNNISPEILSAMTRIPYNTIIPFYYGYAGKNNPSLSKIRKITKFLNCKFEDIF